MRRTGLPFGRLIRFASVGATCALIQWALLGLLIEIGVPSRPGFVVSFVASAQVNFLLSRAFTWADRMRDPAVAGRSRRAWATYNLGALASLLVSSVTFALLVGPVGHWWLADAIALASGMAISFGVGDRLVFHPGARGARPDPGADVVPDARALIPLQRREPGQPGPPPASTPDGASARSATGSGIAMFLPAYNEAINLPTVVGGAVDALAALTPDHDVIIVDDGSRDDTVDVARSLAERYPTVSLVQHPRNQGYGHALRTGFASGLATGRDWISFMDADGQFDPAQIGAMLDRAASRRSDLVVGYRLHRRDNLMRRVNGRLWHWLSEAMLRFRVRDVDCGFKLVHRNVLSTITLVGSYAAVSPELLAKASRAGFRIDEHPVDHFPRRAGEQTGADLKVIVRSLIGLLRLRFSLRRDAAGGTDRAEPATPDRLYAGSRLVTLLVGAGAAIASIVAFLYYYGHGSTLAYDDSVSHMLIARRVISSPTPGLAQLGSVWLPLPHLFMAPLIWSDTLFYDGIAGSLPSMAAFVATAVLLFRTATLLTGRQAAGVVAAVAFVANPNALYMQSTPMTETLLFAFLVGAVYGLARWAISERWQDLARTGVAVLGATLTRYEGWVMLVSVTAAIVVIAVVRRYDRIRLEATLLFFFMISAVGILGWLLWNLIIFGNALDFQEGKFAKPSLWVSAADKAVGSPDVALHTYAAAVAGTVGLPLLVLASVGFVAYLARRPGAVALAPLTPLVLFPFFVYALYAGQRPLHVRPLDPDLYNLRFGLLMVLPAALFAGCAAAALGQTFRRAARALPAVVALVIAAVLALSGAATAVDGNILTLNEPRDFSRARAGSTGVAAWLRGHYTGGRILMQGFGNEYVLFAGHVPLSQDVYEGSYQVWQPSLRDPAGHGIEWIYMTRQGSDEVWAALHASPRLSSYVLAYSDGTREIYRRAT